MNLDLQIVSLVLFLLVSLSIVASQVLLWRRIKAGPRTDVAHGEDRRNSNSNQALVSGILAIFYTLGYLIMTGLLYFVDVPESNEKPLLFLLGLMSGPQVAIIQWAFGSSQSAEAAQRAIEQRQGRSEAVVAEIAKSVPTAAAAAAAGASPAPIKAETVNVDAANVEVNGAPKETPP